ncbi:MAG: hypothetical protein WCT03_19855 [Candidatus Obscuribacterales bacterium]|jgi:hypothetical protein
MDQIIHLFSNDELVGFVLEGNSLNRNRAREFEEKLESESADLRIRLMLLGYYETRHLHSKSNRQMREAHILWLLNNLADHPFWTKSFGIVMEAEDPELYQHVREFWFDLMNTRPSCWQIFANAAFYLAFSEPKEAKRVAKVAQKIDASNRDIDLILSLIDQHKDRKAGR